MSEETTTNTDQAKQPTLQERLNSAYIAEGYVLLNGGTDNMVMIYGGKEGREPIDLLFTYDGLVEAVENLRPDTEKKIIISND